MLKVWIQRLKTLSTTFFSYPISAFAAQTAFFLIISAFPFAMLLITLMGYIPGLQELTLSNQLVAVMPDWFGNFITRILNEIYSARNTALISAAVLSTLLAASKGFISLIRGMNLVYGLKEKRNYFAIRGMAVLSTLIMMLALVLTLLLLVFGDKILGLVTQYVPALAKTAIVIVSFRAVVIFVLLTTLFLVVYLGAPNRRSTLRAELPGAVFSALGWIGFSFLFALYVQHASTYVYGSLTAAVLIMLWLYACIYMLFLGGELNCYLRQKRNAYREE